MRENTMWLTYAPELSDQAACEILDFLYEFINAFENQYADQLSRDPSSSQQLMSDLFDETGDEIPF